MNNSLENPLALLIAQAAATPAQTGDTARYQRRMAGAGGATVILLDVSSSMDERAGQRRRIEILQEALDQVRPQLPEAVLIAFGSTPVELAPGAALPPPAGGTAMHAALREAAARRPGLTLVISDGQPDDPAAALREADGLTGRIDVIYVGPDDDRVALAFMRRLARAGGGQVIVHDLRGRVALAAPLRRLLALPAPP